MSSCDEIRWMDRRDRNASRVVVCVEEHDVARFLGKCATGDGCRAGVYSVFSRVALSPGARSSADGARSSISAQRAGILFNTIGWMSCEPFLELIYFLGPSVL